jgi:hypothetical protein
MKILNYCLLLIFVLFYSCNDKDDTTDQEVPIITLVGASEISITHGEVYEDQGATATDNVDGDLTDAITETGVDAIDTAVSGTYLIKYNVIDAAGNAADEVVRTVIVIEKDDVSPQISLIGKAAIDILVGSEYVDQGATATDNVDGDITDLIVIVGVDAINTDNAGVFTITYNVTDAAGNIAVEVVRNVNVITEDITAPVIRLIGEPEITLEVGGVKYKDAGATADDNVQGDLTEAIVIEGVDSVDTATIGTYIVTYNVSDAAENTAEEVTRKINVVSSEFIRS